MKRIEDTIQMRLWKLIQAYQLPDTKIWHVPNGEKRGARTASKLHAMGVLPGVTDFCYIANCRTGYLELKSLKGVLTAEQRDFAAICMMNLQAYSVARSVLEGALILQTAGVLDPKIKFRESVNVKD